MMLRVILLVLPVVTGQVSSRYETKEFSYLPPAGWIGQTTDGVPYKRWLGPAEAGPVALDTYDLEPVVGNLPAITQQFETLFTQVVPMSQVVQRRAFTTLTGKPGSKLVIAINRQKPRTCYAYVFQLPSGKGLVLVGACEAERERYFVDLYDRVADSVQFR